MFRKANPRDAIVQRNSIRDDKIASQVLVILKTHSILRKLSITLTNVIRILLYGLFIVGFTGCAATRTITPTERGFLQQVLVTQAIRSSLEHMAEIPIPTQSSVQVVTAGLTDDQYFATQIFKGWLGRHGYRVLEEGADYKIRVIWHGIGTRHNEFFFGIPPINSTFIPIATPELSIYKSVRESAVARFSIDILKEGNGQFISSTSAYGGNVYYAVKTLFFGFTYELTNLAPPPLERDSVLY